MTAKEEIAILQGHIKTLELLNGMAFFLLLRAMPPKQSEHILSIFTSVVFPRLEELGASKEELFMIGAGKAVDSFKSLVVEDFIEPEPEPEPQELVGKAMEGGQ